MRSRFGLIPGVRKIAVVRANGIGDLVFALPALDSLRSAYPQAEIVLLACDWHRSFLTGRPGPIDRVIPIPPCRGVREDTGRPENAHEMAAFFAAMRQERFDVAFQLHGGGRYSNPFVLGLGARVTVGLKTPNAQPLDRWIPYTYFQSEIVRYLEVATLAGARIRSLEPRLEVMTRDLDESWQVVPGDRPFAVLHPSATDPKRRWPAACFARLARALRARGLDVFIVGIDRDRAIARAVAAEAGLDDAADLTGRLSLGGLAGVVSRASIVVSNDSGPLHLAGATGSPTVGIYWCGNLITAAPVMRARHRPVISWRLACPRCGADVPVEDVTRAAFDLLEEEELEREEADRREAVGEAR